MRITTWLERRRIRADFQHSHDKRSAWGTRFPACQLEQSLTPSFTHLGSGVFLTRNITLHCRCFPALLLMLVYPRLELEKCFGTGKLKAWVMGGGGRGGGIVRFALEGDVDLVLG